MSPASLSTLSPCVLPLLPILVASALAAASLRLAGRSPPDWRCRSPRSACSSRRSASPSASTRRCSIASPASCSSPSALVLTVPRAGALVRARRPQASPGAARPGWRASAAAAGRASSPSVRCSASSGRRASGRRSAPRARWRHKGAQLGAVAVLMLVLRPRRGNAAARRRCARAARRRALARTRAPHRRRAAPRPRHRAGRRRRRDRDRCRQAARGLARRRFARLADAADDALLVCRVRAHDAQRRRGSPHC